jgi:hypothetical protein
MNSIHECQFTECEWEWAFSWYFRTECECECEWIRFLGALLIPAYTLNVLLIRL